MSTPSKIGPSELTSKLLKGWNLPTSKRAVKAFKVHEYGISQKGINVKQISYKPSTNSF